MIILRQKQFLSLVALILLVCCQAQNSRQIGVSKVLNGILIEQSQQYQFADEESKYLIGSDTILLRSTVEYDETEELIRLTLFKPEGALKYTKEEILKDMKLLDFVDVKYQQKWILANDTLLLVGADTLNIELIEVEKGREILLSRKGGKNITVFELY